MKIGRSDPDSPSELGGPVELVSSMTGHVMAVAINPLGLCDVFVCENASEVDEDDTHRGVVGATIRKQTHRC